MPPTARPLICLITPYGALANNGNWHTAARWQHFLRGTARLRLATEWDGLRADLMIALHARRSAPSIHAFAAAHPNRPLCVVLTGTDLYRDIKSDPDAQRSLALATHLVVLQELGPEAVPAEFRAKTRVIFQSTHSLKPGEHRANSFEVAVVGHLRDEKDPLTVIRAARRLPAPSRIHLLHAGSVLDAELATAARTATAELAPRYRWLGAQSRAQARQLMRRSQVLLHASKMEGGAQVILEAITAHTPVIASDCDGNVGMLGRGYPGLFPVGDDVACARLLQRAETEPAFLETLRQACAQRAPLFAPAREQAALLELVGAALAGGINTSSPRR
ncbi:MAG: selenoneine biosynthesis selenosugar synthase SenB [Burkholderiaceae bacterium]